MNSIIFPKQPFHYVKRNAPGSVNTMMKRVIILAWLTLLATSLYSQKTHSGMYFSAGVGPCWGTSNGYDNQGSYVALTGTGVEVDFQLGASLMKGLILHGTISSKSVTGPSINGISLSNNYSLVETTYAVGVTHYTTRNFFLTGNVGVGKFIFSDNTRTTSTKDGFSFLLKAGRELWVSKKLGIGAAFTFGKTMLTSNDGSYTEKWKSNRFGVVLQFTID